MRLGIDLGGTLGRVAVYEMDGHDEVDRREFPISRIYERDMQSAMEVARQLQGLYGEPTCIGMLLAGKVDESRNTLVGAGSLQDYVGKPLRASWEEVFSCPIVIGNDAEGPALAEALYGHGVGRKFWFLIWGTGVGGCQIHVDHSNRPIILPGEPGHHRLLMNATHSRQCRCGQLDCLEAYIGGWSIPEWLHVQPGLLTAEGWLDIAHYAAIGIGNILLCQPTDLIVFGGGLIHKQAWLLPIIMERLNETLRVISPPRLLLSQFGENAGTLGAVALLDALQ